MKEGDEEGRMAEGYKAMKEQKEAQGRAQGSRIAHARARRRGRSGGSVWSGEWKKRVWGGRAGAWGKGRKRRTKEKATGPTQD